MDSKGGKAEKIYINEIIRITYKCNWRCKFCNVLKTNNFGEHDVTHKEVIYQILSLSKKYSAEERNNLILSFSGGEPTLNKNLLNYIRLAKEIGVKTVEIQTNGTKLFKEKEYIFKLIDAGLDEIFLAQHSHKEEVNKKLGSYYRVSDFIEWVDFVHKNEIYKQISTYINIVVTNINLYHIYEYIKFLTEVGFIQILPIRDHSDGSITRKISFGFVQPNGYAEINKEEVLIRYTDEDIHEIEKIVALCKETKILPDFHFVSPPLCILDFPEYNLEYERLRKLEADKQAGKINASNLDSYKYLWKEKIKFKECSACKHSPYCLGFYRNWVEFVSEEYARKKIQKYLTK